MTVGYQALTEKEKQALRLVARAYDAKSMASHLGLSVHTVNERLRFARRKLEVSSSREAARLLIAEEGHTPDLLGDERMGGASAAEEMTGSMSPKGSRKARPLLVLTIGGAIIMSVLLATILLTTSMQASTHAAPTSQQAETEVEQSARQWLALVDAGNWNDSWAATGLAFKELNTSETWASVSEEVRTPLGAVTSRKWLRRQHLPAPPYGYEMVEFRTSFEGRPETTETVTLVREGGGWKVVSYLIGQ